MLVLTEFVCYTFHLSSSLSLYNSFSNSPFITFYIIAKSLRAVIGPSAMIVRASGRISKSPFTNSSRVLPTPFVVYQPTKECRFLSRVEGRGSREVKKLKKLITGDKRSPQS